MSKKLYTVKVTCEYYVVVEAENESEAIDEAISANYEISDLQNFDYFIEYIDEDCDFDEEEDEEDDDFEEDFLLFDEFID